MGHVAYKKLETTATTVANDPVTDALFQRSNFRIAAS
jgi:hypothetical protein